MRLRRLCLGYVHLLTAALKHRPSTHKPQDRPIAATTMASSSSAAAVTDASFLNGAGRVDTYEEVKAPEDLETGTPASANILPLEIEDGAAGGKKGDKAEGGKVLEGDGAAVGTPKPAKSFCARCVWRVCGFGGGSRGSGSGKVACV